MPVPHLLRARFFALFLLSPLLVIALKIENSEQPSSIESKCRCLPNQPCWPSITVWQAFNKTVRGNLIATTPVARECHNPYYNKVKCDEIQANYYNDEWRRSLPGTVLQTNWETFHGQGCLGFNPSAPCNQGSVPLFTAKAMSIADTQETIRFASKQNIRLVIKNTGHDFLGRSTGPSSLSLWTTSMRNISI